MNRNKFSPIVVRSVAEPSQVREHYVVRALVRGRVRVREIREPLARDRVAHQVLLFGERALHLVVERARQVPEIGVQQDGFKHEDEGGVET